VCGTEKRLPRTFFLTPLVGVRRATATSPDIARKLDIFFTCSHALNEFKCRAWKGRTLGKTYARSRSAGKSAPQRSG
jgi:hypothetical protein